MVAGSHSTLLSDTLCKHRDSMSIISLYDKFLFIVGESVTPLAPHSISKPEGLYSRFGLRNPDWSSSFLIRPV